MVFGEGQVCATAMRQTPLQQLQEWPAESRVGAQAQSTRPRVRAYLAEAFFIRASR
jgi:hypothetical protein